MDPEIFIELSKILAITVFTTGLFRILKQPATIGYIFSGILAGPFFLNIINSTGETITTFSQIGVALLLFFVGLNLNPKVIKDIGKIAVLTGVGQVLFTTGIGYLIIISLGFPTITAIYMAIALAFSSTIIIMKLLSDKEDLDSLYGKISIGFLIVQDFIAIILLLIISSMSTGGDLAALMIETVIKGLIGISLLVAIAIYFLPTILKKIAKSQEFLLLFSLAWCFAIASIFHYINFSIEAGALLAGVALSISPYHFEISSKMKPLRDFFIILFFIMLGSQMIFSNIFENINSILILSIFVLIGNPLIVMILMGLEGYTKRNGFLAGLTVAQISEFSLIVVAMGVSVGHITQETLSLVTAIGLITFAGSTYMILYSHKIYPILSKYLSIFERKGRKVDEHKYYTNEEYEIILFGYNRIGFDVLESLNKLKKRYLIIDYNPDTIINLCKEGHNCRYGDANDSELLDELNFSKTKMIISTIPILETNSLIINKIREKNKKIILVAVAYQIDEALKLYGDGATYVIMPHFLGGKQFSSMIQKNKLDTKKFLKERRKHIDSMAYRKKLGQDHPKREKA
ncbi:MAG: cation:proton antiporter [Candidatus Micrarchaeia archaeon]